MPVVALAVDPAAEVEVDVDVPGPAPPELAPEVTLDCEAADPMKPVVEVAENAPVEPVDPDGALAQAWFNTPSVARPSAARTRSAVTPACARRLKRDLIGKESQRGKAD